MPKFPDLRRFGATILILLSCLLTASEALADLRASPEGATGFGESRLVLGQAVVVTANPHATHTAAEVLANGGNAMDAAIAAAFVLNVVEPQSSGIGGGGFLLHFDSDSGAVVAWDGRERAPAAATPDLFLEEGKPIGFLDAVVGGRAVGTPGLVRMLEAAHRAHGRLAWPRLLEPAIAIAEDGFLVSPRLHALIARDRFLAQEPAARALFFDSRGEPLAVGARLRNPQLGAVLRRIAEEGADVLHHGELAREIVEAVRAEPRPGLLDEADLAGYRPVRSDALCGPYRLLTVCGMPPPSAGGGAVLAILAMLERFDLGALGPDSVMAAHLFAEAGRLAYADREWYGDPQAMPVAVEALLAPSYLSRRASGIGGQPSRAPALPGRPDATELPPRSMPAEHPATSHVSIVDADGNAVSLTASIEHVFGSRRMVRGFLLNNQLTDFSFQPQAEDGTPHPNRVIGGHRPRSSMAPTLVFDAQGGLLAVTGAPGGSRIINYVASSIIGVVDWGLSPDVVLMRPHVGSRNGPIEVEDTPAGRQLAEALRKMGHQPQLADMTSGLALIVRDGGQWSGAADPRREGVARALNP